MNGISAVSRQYVRSRITEFMDSTCVIERVSSGSYDQNDLTWTPGSREQLYAGICRIWEMAAPAQVQIGQSDIEMYATQLSIPWSVDAVIQRHDEIRVVTCPSDNQMVGKRFEILSVAKSGQLRATRRFTVTALQEQK